MRRGLGGQAFAQLSVFGFQFASVPLFLHFWGLQLYGEWLVLFALPAWLTMSDLGFATATANEMTMRESAGDRDGARAAFQTTWVVICSVSAAVAILAGLAAVFLPVSTIFSFEYLDPVTTTLVLSLLLIQALLTVQQNLLAGGLVCVGAYGEVSALDGATRIFAFTLMAAAVAAGLGPAWAAAGLVAGTASGFVAMSLRVRKRAGWLRYGFGAARLAVARRLLLPSLGFTGFVAGNALAIQGPVIVIGALLGPAATPVYVTLRMLVRAVLTALTSVFAIVRPEIAIAHGAGDRAMVRRLHRRAVQLALWLGGLAIAFLLVLGGPVVGAWTGGKVVLAQPLFVLLLAGMLAAALWQASATMLYATNRSHVVAPIYVSAAAAGLLLGAALAGPFGLDGVAAAACLAEIVVALWVVARTLPAVGDRPVAFLLGIGRPPLDLWRILLRR